MRARFLFVSDIECTAPVVNLLPLCSDRCSKERHVYARTCTYVYTCIYAYIPYIRVLLRRTEYLRCCGTSDHCASVHDVTLEFSCGISATKFSSRIFAFVDFPPHTERDAGLPSYLHKFLYTLSRGKLVRI